MSIMNPTAYEILKDLEISHLDDILCIINCIEKYGLENPEDIAEKADYRYGGAVNGLINALYSALLHLDDNLRKYKRGKL